MKIFAFLLVLIILAGCNKPDKNAHKIEPYSKACTALALHILKDKKIWYVTGWNIRNLELDPKQNQQKYRGFEVGSEVYIPAMERFRFKKLFCSFYYDSGKPRFLGLRFGDFGAIEEPVIWKQRPMVGLSSPSEYPEIQAYDAIIERELSKY